ncbi:MAG: oligosaccharide flippase family protein [bacterium]
MTISRRVAKNTFFLVLDNIVSRPLGFVVNILLFRRLGIVEFGIFSFACSFPQLFLFAADLGLEVYTIRETAANRDGARDYIAKILPLKMILFCSALALTFIALAFTSDRHARTAVYIFSLYIIGRSFMSFFVSILKGLEQMQYAALLSILESVLAAGFVIILIGSGDSAFKVGVWYCITLAAAMIPAAAIVFRQTGFALPRIDAAYWKKALSESWPYAVASLLILIHNNVDIVMLKFIKGSAPVALYKSGIIILTSVGFVQLALSAAVFPVITRFYAKEPGALEKTYEKTFKLLSLVGLPFYVGGAVVAKPLLTAVFGPESAHGAHAMSILCAAYLFINYGTFYSLFAIGIEKQKQFIKINSCTVLLNIALNSFLIPRWGIEGAAASTVASTGTLILWVHFTIMRPFRKFPAAVFLLKLTFALAAAAAAAHFSLGLKFFDILSFNGSAYSAQGLNVLIPIASGAFAYIASVLIIRPLTKNDIALFKKALFGEKLNSKA